MIDYIHKGVIKTNGIVDTTQLITDTSKLEVLSSDDRFHLNNTEVGNLEWWYFDIIDFQNKIILKIVVHLGTDPLRKKFFLQLAISIKTPNSRQALSRRYSLSDFHASRSTCDIRFKNDFHAVYESSDQDTLYHLSINIDKFKAKFTFISEIEGWKPLGNEVNIIKGRKKGAFSWIIPVPKAQVVGEFDFNNKKYNLKGAFGYHDHNYWKVGKDNKLFVDDVLSKWYWGRVLAGDYTIIFMDTYFRQRSIKSFMLAKEDKIIQSSNNLIEVFPSGFRTDEEIQTSYPSRIAIRSIDENNPVQVILKGKELIDRKDLLEGVNPVIKWLIKHLVSRPAYYGISAESSLNIAGEEIKGIAIYEFMLFRNRWREPFKLRGNGSS